MAGFDDKKWMNEPTPVEAVEPFVEPLVDIPILSEISQGVGNIAESIDNTLPTTQYDEYIPNIKTLAAFLPGIGDLDTGEYSLLDMVTAGIGVKSINKSVEALTNLSNIKAVRQATDEGIDWVRQWNRHPEAIRRKTSAPTEAPSVYRAKLIDNPFVDTYTADSWREALTLDGYSRMVRNETKFAKRLEDPIDVKNIREGKSTFHHSAEDDTAWLGRAYRGRGKMRINYPTNVGDYVPPLKADVFLNKFAKNKWDNQFGGSFGERYLNEVRSTAAHEADHLTDGGLSLFDRRIIEKSLNEGGLKGLDARLKNISLEGEGSHGLKYYSNPLEIHARVQELRQAIGWKSFNDVPTTLKGVKDQIYKMRRNAGPSLQNHKAWKGLMNVVDPEEIPKLMKDVSFNTPQSEEQQIFNTLFPESVIG